MQRLNFIVPAYVQAPEQVKEHMQQEAIIGIDIGTTSTKAVAFASDGALLYQFAVAYPLYSSSPGYAELNPHEVLEAVISTLRQVIGELRVAGYKLIGVSFSSAMHSLIVLDEDNKPLTNCITWADTRSKAQAEKLKQHPAAHQLYLETGTPLHPMGVLPKLLWLQDEAPELFRKAARFAGIKAYVWFRLFGELVVDYSVASATGLFHSCSLSWHETALQIAGITAKQLPVPVTPTYCNYSLKPEYAAALQLQEPVPFIIGASDGCLANLGANALADGHAAVTIGTSGAVRVAASQPAADPQQRVFSYILTPGRYVLGGAVNNGGVVLQWFRDTFYRAETEAALHDRQNIFALMCEEAATAPAGADGLLFLPYLLGERAPLWDASARACFIGLQLSHTRAHIVRALLEGITLNIYSVACALEQVTGPIRQVYANGGFSRSGFWVQLLADVFNKEVHLTETYESSAFGAAILGLQALGKIEKLEDASRLVKITRTYTPNPINHQVYQQLYALFSELYPKLKDTFSKLGGLSNEPTPGQTSKR